MPLRITNRTVKNSYINGLDFAGNDSLKFIHGNVSHLLQITQELSVSWESQSSISVKFEAVGGKTITRSSGDFKSDDNLSDGDIVDIFLFDGSGNPSGSILDEEIQAVGIDSNGRSFIEFVNVLAIPDGIYGAGSPDDGLNEGRIEIKGKTPLENLFMNFGFPGNDDPPSFISPYDGTKLGYYVFGVGVDSGGGRDTNFVDGVFWGPFKNNQTGSLRAKYDSTSLDGYTQIFTIEHIVRVPDYLDGEKNNIINNDPPERLEDSYKYAVRYEMRNSGADENSAKVIEDAEELGSIGYFNRNYNDYNNDFSISDLFYLDSNGDPIDSLKPDEICTIGFNVNSNHTSFVNGTTPILLQTSYLATNTEYEKKEQSFYTVFNYDEFRDNLGNNTPTGGPVILNMETVFMAGNQVYVEAQILYTLKSDDDQYKIHVTVGDDPSLYPVPDIAGISNVSNLIVDCQNFQTSGCIEGLLEVDYFNIIDFRGDSWNKYGGYIEDGIIIDWSVNINHDKQAEINNMYAIVIAYNPITKQNFLVKKEKVPFEFTANKTDVYDYKEIITNQIVGYKLDQSDIYGLRTINTGILSGNMRNYYGKFGIKIPYQNWIALQGVDDVFKIPSEPNNGQNLDSSRYSDKEGYELRFGVTFGMSGIDNLGIEGFSDYTITKPGADVGTYNDNPDITKTFEYIDESANLVDDILSSENTTIRVTVSHDSMDLNSNYIGILRIEKENSLSDREIYESNEPGIKSNYPDNIFLTPLSKTVVSGDLVFTTTVNSELIEDETGYKTSIVIVCPGLQCVSFNTFINPPIDGPFVGEVTVFTGADDFEWNLPDGSTVLGSVLNTSDGGFDGTVQSVSLCTEDLSKIEAINLGNNFLTGIIDFSPLVNCREFFLGDGEIDQFIIDNGVDISVLNLSDNSLSSLDLSKRRFVSGTINDDILLENNNLSSLIFENSIGVNKTNDLRVFNNDLTVLNLSSFYSIDRIRCENNTSLSTLILNNFDDPLRIFQGNNCDLPSVDFSILTNAGIGGGAEWYFQDNENLEFINVGTVFNGPTLQFFVNNCNLSDIINLELWIGMTSVSGWQGRFQDNNMTAGEVNKTLNSLAIISSFLAGIRSIYIGGAIKPNAAPDAVSGGYDGLAAIATLNSYGINVFTN